MGSYSGVNFFIVTKTGHGKWVVTDEMKTGEYLERLDAGTVKVPAAGK